MKLLYQTHSPYARKVLVMAHEVGLVEQIQVIHHETSPTLVNEAIFERNPLGKVPILEHGTLTLFDSSVICEYLDSFHNRPLVLGNTHSERLQIRKLESVATGLADAGILVRWEIARRPENKRYEPFSKGQLHKVESAYKYLNEYCLSEAFTTINLAQIAVATAIDWVEYVKLPLNLTDYPQLNEWFCKFCQRPSMQKTTYSGTTSDVTVE